MTTMEKMCELIMKVKRNKLSREELKPDADLGRDLGFDSLAQTELLVLVEEAFSLQIPIEDALGRQTIREVVNYVDGRLAG